MLAGGSACPRIDGSHGCVIAVLYYFDRVLDLVAAWEDVNKCIYDPVQARFLHKTNTTLPSMPSSAPEGVLPQLSSLHQEIKELRDQIKKGAKKSSKQKAVQYQDRLITVEVIDEFLDESRVADWMYELARMTKKSVEAAILDDPTAPLWDLWTLLTTTHRAHAQKYQRYRGSPSKSPGKRPSRKSKRSSTSCKSSRRPSSSGFVWEFVFILWWVLV